MTIDLMQFRQVFFALLSAKLIRGEGDIRQAIR